MEFCIEETKDKRVKMRSIIHEGDYIIQAYLPKENDWFSLIRINTNGTLFRYYRNGYEEQLKEIGFKLDIEGRIPEDG